MIELQLGDLGPCFKFNLYVNLEVAPTDAGEDKGVLRDFDLRRAEGWM